MTFAFWRHNKNTQIEIRFSLSADKSFKTYIVDPFSFRQDQHIALLHISYSSILSMNNESIIFV